MAIAFKWAFLAFTATMSSDGRSMPVASPAARGAGSSEATAPAVSAGGAAATGEPALLTEDIQMQKSCIIHE